MSEGRAGGVVVTDDADRGGFLSRAHAHEDEFEAYLEEDDPNADYAVRFLLAQIRGEDPDPEDLARLGFELPDETTDGTEVGRVGAGLPSKQGELSPSERRDAIRAAWDAIAQADDTTLASRVRGTEPEDEG